jgi:oligopeptidase B
MCDPTIPLTTPEWSQWGNPNKKEDFDIIKKYCPYSNLKISNYPNLLLMAGLNDPRVQFWEPAKFIAKLRYLRKNSKLALLKMEMDKGHFNANDRYRNYRERSFVFSFLLKTLNINY